LFGFLSQVVWQINSQCCHGSILNVLAIAGVSWSKKLPVVF